ncbi:MAG: DUF1320 domain-containing protein [Cyanobacteria bacterium P01_H01_bin.130]
MSYATVDEFVAAFPAEAGVLTNLEDPASTVVDVPELQGALDTASAEIDLYLRGRYALPLESLVPLDPEDPLALPVFPGVLVGWCRDIARYRLDRVRPSEDVRRRYDDAIRGLEAIAAGTVDLLHLDTQGGSARAIARDRVWDGEQLSGFGVG